MPERKNLLAQDDTDASPTAPPSPADQGAPFIGDSVEMRRIFSAIRKVAQSSSTVLIYGESGTGKELVARAIHNKSGRSHQPLITVNCGAIPEDLLESELFGHEKGAFTGAIRTRIGRFELAQNGTIFLDEIGDMPLGIQVKLLRVVQERQFERVGGHKTFQADVRILAATNQDLEQSVKEKKFREDLFYRLNVIPLQVPPLRDRADDIPRLCHFFLAKFSQGGEKAPMTISGEAMETLCQYPWPGNVRELENLMEMLTVMNEINLVTPEHLPARIRGKTGAAPSNRVFFGPAGLDLNQAVAEFERDLIQKALVVSGGVKSKAAQLLRLNRTTLVEKIKRHDLTVP